jgi:hypothetical protein
VTLAVALGLGGLVPRPGFQLPRRFAFRRSRRGAGGDPLGEALLAFGGLGLQPCLGLPQPGQPTRLAGQRFGQLVPTLITKQSVLALVGVGGLAQDLGDLGVEPVKGAVGLVRTVAGQLGAIQGDRADLDHASGRAQLERGDQEAGQGLLVADAEARNGHMVRELVGGKDPEGDVLVAASLDLPGGAHADAVRVEQHAEQGFGVVGGMAVPVIAVGSVERGEVELVDHVQDEPGEVALGEPVAQVGGSRNGWSRSPRRKL